MTRELPLILQLDKAGNPQKWINHEKAAYYYAKGLVAWTMAADDFTLWGGVSRMSGQRSSLTMETIIAVEGDITKKQLEAQNRIPLTNRTLFRRDRNICAYCGNEFTNANLSRDHIHPTSKGGENTWMNVVASCHSCNKRKDDRTPEEAGMKLMFVPYIPNRAEYLILQNRRILADQMEFLKSKVSKESRILLPA